MPKTTTAAHPSAMPAIWALLIGGLSLAAGWPDCTGAVEDVGGAEEDGAVEEGIAAADVADSVVEPGAEDALVVVVVVVVVLVTLVVVVVVANVEGASVGASNGPVPDGMTKVAMMASLVGDAALATPTHM